MVCVVQTVDVEMQEGSKGTTPDTSMSVISLWETYTQMHNTDTGCMKRFL